MSRRVDRFHRNVIATSLVLALIATAAVPSGQSPLTAAVTLSGFMDGAKNIADDFWGFFGVAQQETTPVMAPNEETQNNDLVSKGQVAGWVPVNTTSTTNAVWSTNSSLEEQVRRLLAALPNRPSASQQATFVSDLARLRPDGILTAMSLRLQQGEPKSEVLTGLFGRAINALSPADRQRFFRNWTQTESGSNEMIDLYSIMEDANWTLMSDVTSILTGRIWDGVDPLPTRASDGAARALAVEALRHVNDTDWLIPLMNTQINTVENSPEAKAAAVSVLAGSPHGWESLGRRLTGNLPNVRAPSPEMTVFLLGEMTKNAEDFVRVHTNLPHATQEAVDSVMAMVRNIALSLNSDNRDVRYAGLEFFQAVGEDPGFQGDTYFRIAIGSELRERLTELMDDIDWAVPAHRVNALFSTLDDAITIAIPGLNRREGSDSEMAMYVGMLNANIDPLLDERPASLRAAVDALKPYLDHRLPNLARTNAEAKKTLVNIAYALTWRQVTGDVPEQARNVSFREIFLAIAEFFGGGDNDLIRTFGSETVINALDLRGTPTGDGVFGTGIRFVSAQLRHTQHIGQTAWLCSELLTLIDNRMGRATPLGQNDRISLMFELRWLREWIDTREAQSDMSEESLVNLRSQIDRLRSNFE